MGVIVMSEQERVRLGFGVERAGRCQSCEGSGGDGSKLSSGEEDLEEVQGEQGRGFGAPGTGEETEPGV